MNDERQIIRIEVDPELLDLVPGFLHNRETDVEVLTRAVSERDLKTAGIVGHRLRGAAGGYGFDVLGTMGGRIEEAASHGSVEDIALVVAEMVDHLARLEIHVARTET